MKSLQEAWQREEKYEEEIRPAEWPYKWPYEDEDDGNELPEDELAVWEWQHENADPPADDVFIGVIIRELKKWRMYRHCDYKGGEHRLSEAVKILTEMKKL